MNYGYYRPGLPFVVKNLIIINAIIFVFFKPFQLITYMFMHGGFWHIFFNMFSLYMFGSVLENYWGGKKFFLYYMVCGIGAGLINELVMYLQIAFAETPGLVEAAINRVPTVGASGAIYGRRHEGQVDGHHLRCHRAHIGPVGQGRQCGPFRPPRRYDLRYHHDTVLEEKEPAVLIEAHDSDGQEEKSVPERLLQAGGDSVLHTAAAQLCVGAD